MRNAFADGITELACRDRRVVLLSADIGNRLFDSFKVQCPHRFYNCGVAESNMISMAAGLAMSGLRPVCYTIAPFITTRALEQIRVDLCYHEQPVVLVGVGAGLCYAQLGATHEALEDIAHLRVLPGMTVICPADGCEVQQALAAALHWDGPVYLRLGKKGEPVIHARRPHFQIGEGIIMRDGSDVCLLGTGIVMPLVVEAADLLQESGISVRVVSLHTVKPLDRPLLADCFARFEVVGTVEEHSVLGGLGSAVAEWFVDQASPSGRLIRVGTPDRFLHEAGGQCFARRRFELTPQVIARRMAAALSPDQLSVVG